MVAGRAGTGIDSREKYRRAKAPRPLDPDRNPWDRQPTETKKAYEAFCAYRDSEERAVNRITAEFGGTVPEWSKRHLWAHRAFEWDRYLTRKDLEDTVRYRRLMNARQRRAAGLAQQKVVQWLMQAAPEKFTPQEAARWFEVAVKVERMATGDASEVVKVTGGMVEQMSAEEVAERLAALQSEIGRVVTGVSDPASEVTVDARSD